MRVQIDIDTDTLPPSVPKELVAECASRALLRVLNGEISHSDLSVVLIGGPKKFGGVCIMPSVKQIVDQAQR